MNVIFGYLRLWNKLSSQRDVRYNNDNTISLATLTFW